MLAWVKPLISGFKCVNQQWHVFTASVCTKLYHIVKTLDASCSCALSKKFQQRPLVAMWQTSKWWTYQFLRKQCDYVFNILKHLVRISILFSHHIWRVHFCTYALPPRQSHFSLISGSFVPINGRRLSSSTIARQIVGGGNFTGGKDSTAKHKDGILHNSIHFTKHNKTQFILKSWLNNT